MKLSTFDAYKTLENENIIKLSDEEIRELGIPRGRKRARRSAS